MRHEHIWQNSDLNFTGLTGAKLSNISDYQSVLILTKILTGNCLLPLVYLGCTTNQRYILWVSVSYASSGLSGSSCVFSGLHSWSWWRRRLGLRRYHDSCCSDNHFWTCLWDLPVSMMKHFLTKNKTSGLGTTLLKWQIIRISELTDIRLKEFCCTSRSQSLLIHKLAWPAALYHLVQNNYCDWKNIFRSTHCRHFEIRRKSLVVHAQFFPSYWLASLFIHSFIHSFYFVHLIHTAWGLHPSGYRTRQYCRV